MTKAQKLLIKDGVNIVVENVDNAPPSMIAHFQQASHLFVDTETTALHPWRGGEIALFQIHDRLSGDTFLGRVQEHQPPPQWLIDTFKMGKTMVGHNIGNFDLHFMHAWGLPWKQSTYYDTLVAESLITVSGRANVSKSLRASVKRRTGYEIDKTIEHGNWRIDEMSDRQKEYAAIDVLSLPALMDEQIEKASGVGSGDALAMEMEVLPVFTQMTINGMPIHKPSLDLYMRQSAEKAAGARAIIRERLGDINVNAPVKLRQALNSLGIDLDSTAKATLIDIIQFDPDAPNSVLLQAILDYRAPSKRTSMYGSTEWQRDHIQPDGRIHARFWQVGADTTRVSSSDPNLQQVPKDGRWIFGHVPGYKMVSVDYSQIEVRIAADIAADEVLMKLLREEDVHSAIAAQMFIVPISAVTKQQRKLAKAAVFTLLFGGGAKRLFDYARQSGSALTFEEAEDLFTRFFTSFEGLRAMRAKAYSLSKNRRVVTVTLPNGARRVLVGTNNSPQCILNTPVQGTAAVGMKYGLILAGKQNLDQYMGAVVHDETVSCVPENIAEEYSRAMQLCLEDGMRQVLSRCPVKTEAKIDDIWLP